MITQIPPIETIKPIRAMYSVRVLDTRRITPTIQAIRVEKPATFVFRTSQAARVILQTRNGPEPHPISIASSPTREYLEFAVRRSESAWKQAFFALRGGATIQIEGPVARFFLDTACPAILIAGGVGITPFKGMLEYAASTHLPITLDLVYSSRTPEEIAYKPELDALAKENSRIKIHYTLTRSTTAQAWNSRVGRIDAELLRSVASGKSAPIFYLCGTPQMLAEMTLVLESLGITPDRILQESFKGYAQHINP